MDFRNVNYVFISLEMERRKSDPVFKILFDFTSKLERNSLLFHRCLLQELFPKAVVMSKYCEDFFQLYEFKEIVFFLRPSNPLIVTSNYD